MTNSVNWTDNGIFPSAGGMFANGFAVDADPMRAVLLVQPNRNDGATPQDRSRSGAVEKTLTARNGAKLSDAHKRYGATALKLERAQRQHVTIAPTGDFAFGTRPFGFGLNLHAVSDGQRMTLVSSGTGPGCYQLAWRADGKVEFVVVGGASYVTAQSFASGRDVHVWVSRDGAGTLRLFLEGKAVLEQAGVTAALAADPAAVFLGSTDGVNDGFDGYLDGFHAASGEPVYAADFGPGLTGPGPEPGGTAYYVSPLGDDAWSGLRAEPNATLSDGPFRTLTKARDAMRGSATIKTTYLRGGRYDLTGGPLTLGTGDAGTRWLAYPGETPVLSGAEKLSGFALEANGLYSVATTVNDLDVVIGDERQRPAQSGVFDPANPYKSGWSVVPVDGSTTTVPFAAGTVGSEATDAGCRIQVFDRERLADHIGPVSAITTGTATPTAWPILPSGITTHKYVDAANGNDANDGSQGSPWKTLAKACASATAGTAVHFASGAYTGNVSQSANGSSGAPIVFVSDSLHGARIVYPASSGRDTAVDCRGHHVHWLGFDVDGTSYGSGTRWRIGLYLTGAQARAAWNKVHDIQTQSGGNTVSGAAIYGDFYYNNLYQIVEFNTVYNIGPPGTTSSNLQCIYMSGTGRVNGNLVYRFAGAGVHGWHAARALEVYNNTIDDGYIAYFVGFASGETYNGFPGPARDCVFRNNVASNCQYGYAEYQSTGPNTYQNNLAYNCTTPWRLLNGNTHSGSLSADPRYVNRAGRDYRLQSGSPCIGAAAASGSPPSLDLDRYARPLGGSLDLGAYEYQVGQAVMTLASAMQYPVRAGGTFRLLNRAAYLRNAGEFGWRASDGKLVVRPKTAGFESEGVYVARVGRLLTLTGTTGATFAGLTFAHGLWTGEAVRLENGANGNTFDGCTFAHVGTALKINGSNANAVKNGTFKSIGHIGVYVEGGATGTVVEKNSFTDIGTILKGGMAVGGNGCSNTVVAKNDILRCARYGVSFKDWNANNAHVGNRVEYNRIEHTLLETADGGAIESLGRSNGDTKLVVKNNWINISRGLATTSTGGWLDGTKGFGVYLDDQTNGATVTNNFIRGTSWASVFIHGGDNNVVENNVIIGSTEQEAAIRIEHVPLAGTAGVPANNVFRKNIVHYTTNVTDYWSLITPGSFTLGPNYVNRSAAYTLPGDSVGDPQFTDEANGNWRVKIGAPVFSAIGFTDLPYELVGVAGIAMGPAGTATQTPPPGGGGENPPPSSSYPATKGGFLVSGNQILDGAMKPVRFTGANINGAEWNDGANTFGLLMGGLTARNYKALLDDFKALGFNLIRLPFADSTVISTRTRHGFAEGPNPEFIGKTPRQIIAMICEYARQIGVYILLDHHRNNASTGSGTQVNFLAGDGFTLADIINNWKTLVTEPGIFGNPAVMGCDVHNEPNGRTFDWSKWAPQAEQICNAIHAVNPNVICFVEGNEISYSQGGEAWGWWGGNLRDFDTRPLTINRMDKLALSIHEYGPYLVGEKPWHRAANFPANMFGTANWGAQTGIWDFFWGFLWRAKRFPILCGEFGAFFTDPVGQKKEFDWIAAFHRYMNGELDGNGQLYLSPSEVGMSWTMWTMAPTGGDTGGIWLNDWKSVATNRYDQYKNHLWKGTITPPPQIRVDGTRI